VDSHIIHSILHTLFKDKVYMPPYYVLPYLLNGSLNTTYIWEIKTERFFNPGEWSHLAKQRSTIPKDAIRQIAKIVYDGIVFREIEKYNIIDNRNAKRDIYNIDGFLDNHVGKVKTLRQYKTSHYFSISLPEEIERTIKEIKSKSRTKRIP
jgi:hypothetical protein